MRRSFAHQLGLEAGPQNGGHALQGLAAPVAGIVIIIIIAASDRFVAGAVGRSRVWGVSEVFTGLTVVAIGTSLPEPAATHAACLTGPIVTRT